MRYRKLGKTDLEVSAIAFGAWAIGGWMWGGTDEKAAIEAIHAGLDREMTSIDTAAVYGFGLSEELVGKAIKGKQRDKLQIFTKFGMRWNTDKGKPHSKSKDRFGNPVNIHKYASKESVIYECEQSLKRLSTDYIDLYQIHWPDETTPIAETMEALFILKEQGKIREAGVCNYDLAQLKEAEKYISLASNQIPYSMLLRDYETEGLPYCIENDIGVLAYSAMQRGILTGKFTPDHHFKEGDHRASKKHFQPENIKRINAFLGKIKPIADAHQATLAQLVLCWTIEQSGVTVALAGARNAKQAEENAGAAEIQLSADENNLILQSLSELELV